MKPTVCTEIRKVKITESGRTAGLQLLGDQGFKRENINMKRENLKEKKCREGSKTVPARDGQELPGWG